MNIGVLRERGPFDRRVALTPAIVRRLTSSRHDVWVESGAGDGAMFPDDDYLRAGAQIAYSPAEVIQRSDLLPKIARPTAEELNQHGFSITPQQVATGVAQTRWPGRFQFIARTAKLSSPSLMFFLAAVGPLSARTAGEQATPAPTAPRVFKKFRRV